MTKRSGTEQAPEADPEQTSEYDAFEDLTRKLLSVSKTDLDEAREREDAEKR
jgi:hypothetical protein